MDPGTEDNYMNEHVIGVRRDASVQGYDFESTVGSLFDRLSLPVADEYVLNWHESDFEVMVDSIELDGALVWQENSISTDDWTEDDDRLIEGLTGYVENSMRAEAS